MPGPNEPNEPTGNAGKEEALHRLRRLRGRLPAGAKFDRDEANERDAGWRLARLGSTEPELTPVTSRTCDLTDPPDQQDHSE